MDLRTSSLCCCGSGFDDIMLARVADLSLVCRCSKARPGRNMRSSQSPFLPPLPLPHTTSLDGVTHAPFRTTTKRRTGFNTLISRTYYPHIYFSVLLFLHPAHSHKSKGKKHAFNPFFRLHSCRCRHIPLPTLIIMQIVGILPLCYLRLCTIRS